MNKSLTRNDVIKRLSNPSLAISTNFNCVNIEYEDLKDIDFIPQTTFHYSRFGFSNLSELTLSNMIFYSTSFKYASLKNAKFIDSKLTNTNFHNCVGWNG